MSDSANIVLRFLLYVDLMLLFGIALFGLYSLKGQERISGVVLPFRSLLAGAAIVGGALSVIGMLLMVSAMSGESDLGELRPHMEMMVFEMDAGMAWMIRVTMLSVVALALSCNTRASAPGLWLATIAGAIALASLAWNGHGAMDEGVWHFTADILHLLAAGAWLGALVAFFWMSRNSLQSEKHIRLLARAVTRFESVGALIVVVITVTGVVNYLYIAGPNIDAVLPGTYGVLLLIKVALFAGMLVLAALNRLHWGPLLQQSLREGQYRVAANTLRCSVRVELVAGVLIVGLVAWLGTLSPQVDEL